MARRGARGRKGAGRRANYAPTPDQVGVRRYLPVSWANWLGLILFGLIFIALLVEVIAAISQGRGADPVAAAVMAGAFGVMTYLFATTRAKE